ncbi:MAG: hypothetical protein K1Y02_20685, partial [Candidatus Hydrogenedentes bacterium]|nr:hypothetical protein [Candidatus Hydrogenedentota bacterium]
HVPEKRLTIFTDFSGQSSVAALLYFYNAAKSACQVNLELIPVNDPIPPGGRITFGGKYGAVRKAPKEL